ncbi:MAG TPA: prolyl oligopeptidase family serine peptidase [Thermoanaerobaculia bacterium]|nr:prolyl oligopeptidase family serine peptidase [Thermoanaerobaculia bacterium]
MVRRIAVVVVALVFAAGFAQEAPAPDSYRLPPKPLLDLVDAPLPPIFIEGPAGRAILGDTPPLLTIEDLAQPELKLAGARFNPRNREQTRAPYYRDLTLLRVSDGEQKPIGGLPSPLRARNLTWSPDGNRVAFTHATPTTVELWLIDVASASASRLGTVAINAAAAGSPIRWVSDSRSLIVRAVPANAGRAPEGGAVATGPVIQENLGRRTPGRTYQDLLTNPDDAAMFEYHATADVVEVGVDGAARRIGTGALVLSAQPSPDGSHILVETFRRPFSYVVPYFRFPRRIEVWDRAGKLVKQIADLPLADAVPTDFDATTVGPRDAGWRADAPATLYWAEALDEGNARREAAERDRVLMLAAPFTGEPVELARTQLRFQGIEWGGDDLALLQEAWWKTRRTRIWRLRPGSRDAQPQLIFDRSFEDRYADPGEPVTRETAQGTKVLRRSGETIYLTGEGASSEGDRPFLDAFDLRTKKATRLWRSEAPHYEYVVSMVDDRTIVTRREGANEPPNFFRRDLRRRTARALTSIPHPFPQLAGAKKELIRYKRADGLDLTATLYLPPGYDAARDGRLPVLLWAYPEEFKSAAAAAQVSGSPHKFIRPSPMSPLPWLVRGFAILDDPSIPIIGEADAEPNDTYIEQLVSGAQAAVDEVVRRGVGDRDRMAVGGHSYGAFMTANLLAHSDLFRAGIARSGAYNRTLTPFSFQAEERTFWEAADTYMKMSPFTHAQKINEPILLIHGIDDNNTGTFPIQSERLYQALKGLGGTVRLVMLPYESHGYRARESVLHMMWEQDRWLETYVKGAKALTVNR